MATPGCAALPPFTGGSLVTEARLDPLLALVLILAAGLYLYGVHRLHARGDRWPAGRTVLFVGPGLGSIAPVTLALRTLPVRRRRALVAVLHSRVARVVAFPLVAYALFVATPFVLYFTSLYRLTLEHAWLHELVHLHFLAVGCVFFWPLLGLDPLPGRWPYPGRALLMLLSTPFHAVLGLTIMQSHDLIGGDWYPNLHLTWADPHSDQVLAGGILWAGGELVSVTMLAVLVAQWMLDSGREARRVDRRLEL